MEKVSIKVTNVQYKTSNKEPDLSLLDNVDLVVVSDLSIKEKGNESKYKCIFGVCCPEALRKHAAGKNAMIIRDLSFRYIVVSYFHEDLVKKYIETTIETIETTINKKISEEKTQIFPCLNYLSQYFKVITLDDYEKIDKTK